MVGHSSDLEYHWLCRAGATVLEEERNRPVGVALNIEDDGRMTPACSTSPATTVTSFHALLY